MISMIPVKDGVCLELLCGSFNISPITILKAKHHLIAMMPACVSVCRTHPVEWQHIKSKETAMFHILFMIGVFAVVLCLGVVAVLSVISQMIKHL